MYVNCKFSAQSSPAIIQINWFSFTQVHGLLHLLGFDHEISEEAEAEMQKEEEIILKSLGWKGKGLITGAYDNITDGCLQSEAPDGKLFFAPIATTISFVSI